MDALATLSVPTPDLPAAAAQSKVLASSYDVAPNCRPLGSPPPSLPAAADGTDLGAGQAGKCQVQVSGVADLTVGATPFTVSVGSTSVRVTAQLDSKAVLDISTG
jgi:hypothetical protein